MRAEARMTPTKLLMGQIIVVFAIVLAGVWFATQWAAAELAYQPEMGQPWFEAYAPTLFEEAGDRRCERSRRMRRCNLRVTVACTPAQQPHQVRFGTLGRCE